MPILWGVVIGFFIGLAYVIKKRKIRFEVLFNTAVVALIVTAFSRLFKDTRFRR